MVTCKYIIFSANIYTMFTIFEMIYPFYTRLTSFLNFLKRKVTYTIFIKYYTRARLHIQTQPMFM